MNVTPINIRRKVFKSLNSVSYFCSVFVAWSFLNDQSCQFHLEVFLPLQSLLDKGLAPDHPSRLPLVHVPLLDHSPPTLKCHSCSFLRQEFNSLTLGCSVFSQPLLDLACRNFEPQILAPLQESPDSRLALDHVGNCIFVISPNLHHPVCALYEQS